MTLNENGLLEHPKKEKKKKKKKQKEEEEVKLSSAQE